MPALEDVVDIEAFVHWQTGRLGFNEPEAVAEGVALVFELHKDWDPKRCPRFSAYLLTYLPKRLISWHRRELRQSGRGSWSGSRNAYSYRQVVPLESVEAVVHGPD